MGFPDGPEQTDLADAWGTMLDDIQNYLASVGNSVEDIENLGLGDGGPTLIGEDAMAAPFALPSMGDAWYAIAALLAIWIVDEVFVWIGHQISDISILGVHPFRFLGGTLAQQGLDLNSALNPVTSRVKALFLTPLHMVNQVLTRLHNAQSRMQGHIAEHTNTTIPAAQRQATADANDHSDSLAISLQNNISTNRSLEQDDVKSLQNNIDTLRNYVDGAFKSGIESDISDAQQNAETYSRTQLQQVEYDLVQRLSGDEATINGLTTTVDVTLPADISAEVEAARETEQANLVTATQNLQAELNGLQDEINQVNARITADEQTINGIVAELATLSPEIASNTRRISDLETQLSAAQTQLTTDTDQLSTLKTTVKTTQDSLTTAEANQTLTAAQLAPIGLAAGATIATAVATIGANLQKLQTEFDDCAVTNCEGPNNLSTLLQKLLGVFGTLSEVGFIADAIKNPTSAGDATAAVAGTAYTAGHDLLDTILSIGSAL